MIQYILDFVWRLYSCIVEYLFILLRNFDHFLKIKIILLPILPWTEIMVIYKNKDSFTKLSFICHEA